MDYTGERYLSSIGSPETSYEHWHRYMYSTLFCKDKIVLDIACGEGYGSNLLSKYSKKVVGIDFSYDVINFASREYINNNLEFIVGSVTDIPIKGKNIFDLIVSFETIEHINEKNQLRLLAEVKRLLKPGGILIISTPNKYLYTDVLKNKNEFHVKEFYLNEFNDFLKKYFQNVKIMGQKVYSSSYIWDNDNNHGDFVEFELAYKNNRFSPSQREKKILYAVAFCSDKKLDNVQHSLLVDTSDRLTIVRDEWITSLQDKISEMKTHYFAQLIIDTGKGFNKEQSITKEIAGEEEELEFDISKFEGIEKIRFDPLNDMVRLKLKEILIIDAQGKGHREIEYIANCFYKKNNELAFGTNDPEISFKVRDIENAVKVIIRLKYILLGDEVSRYIIKLKQDEIEWKNNTIEVRDEEIRIKDSELIQLKDSLKHKSQQIEHLGNEIKSWESKVQQKDEEIKNLHSDIQSIEEKFKRLLNSWSWKITAPLRKLYSLIPGKSKKNQIF